MKKDFDIHKRTLQYSKTLLIFSNKLPRTDENLVLKKQLIRSGTSVGANVAESNGGNSKKDFANFMNIALKSANETVYWLELIREINRNFEDEIETLIIETDELRRIIAKICINSRK